jgi:exosome complex RNA-binding protein Rrp4
VSFGFALMIARTRFFVRAVVVTQNGALHLSSRDQERERVILKHYLRRMESVTTTARTKNLVRAIINANPKLTSKQNKL